MSINNQDNPAGQMTEEEFKKEWSNFLKDHAADYRQQLKETGEQSQLTQNWIDHLEEEAKKYSAS